MSVVVECGDVVTAYGPHLDDLWRGLCAGQTAIRESDRFAPHQFISRQLAEVASLAMAPGESRVMALLRRLLAPVAGTIEPDTPLLLATTIGEVDHLEQAVLQQGAHDRALADPTHLLHAVQDLLAVNGPAAVVSSACASSTMALSRAAAMVRDGRARRVVVVACDSITEFICSGFSGLLSWSQRPARPFDVDRDGLTPGEAAAWAIVAAADPTACPASAQLCGWGSTADAVHMTAPDPTGRGLARAITKACRMADTSPEDIHLVIAHGTATTLSDAMEVAAFDRLMPKPVPALSIKGGTGHTFAATGLVQTLVAIRALREKILPATVGLAQPESSDAAHFHTTMQQVPADGLALVVNSGFGGVNTALLLKGGMA